MKKNISSIKKGLSLILSLAMLCALVPAFATAPADIDALTAQRIAEIRSTPNTDISGVTGTVYYVSEKNGDDTNDGLSPDSAWQTLSKAISFKYKDGDALLFERGGIYRGHFSITSGMLLGSYGTGDKPRVYGSVNACVSGSWTLVTENIWKYSEDTRYDIGNIVFEGDRDNINAAYAHKVITDTSVVYNDDNISTLLTEDLQFYSVGFAQSSRNTATTLYFYSETDPNERFTQMELCEDGCIFSAKRSNVRVDNIEFRYGAAHGVNGGTISGLTVTNCEFGWIGGGVHHFNGTESKATRFGNAVEIYGTPTDYTVSNNYIWQVYDAGITPQYTTENESIMQNILFSDNVIEYCNYSIEYWNASAYETAIIDNFVIENNIMRFAGEGLCTERPDKNQAAHIKTWNNGINSGMHKNIATDFVIRNNIFQNCDGQMMYLYSDELSSMPVLENNVLIQASDKGGIIVSTSRLGSDWKRGPFIPSVLSQQFPGNSWTYSDLEDTQTGTVGTMSWTLDLPTGHLEITGTGAIEADTAESAPWYAFARDIVSVTVGDGITAIGSYAFYGCDNMKSMEIPATAVSTSGTIGDLQWTYNPETAELTVDGNGAIPDSEEYTTPWKPFANAIRTITVGEGVTAIGTYAFSGCLNLTAINFNAANCANLAKSATDGNNGVNFAFSDCGRNSDGIAVVFGENVTRVPNHLFRPSSTATDSPKVISIAFAGNKCTTLGDHCFRTLDDLTEITLPASLTKIGTFAFGNCSKLTEIAIPATVTSMGGYVFMNCNSLRVIEMPPSLTGSYNPCMFANCYALEKLVIPSGVKSLNDRMFYNCRALTEVVIPDTVTTIGSRIFENCASLNEILIPATVTEITDKAIGYSGSVKNENLTIKCYSGTAAESYAQANGFEYIIMDHYGHTETETVVTPAGCETVGKGEIRCSCGELISETEYPATGHLNIVDDDAVAPTCTETGLTAGSHCADCGKPITAQTVIAATGHTTETVKGTAPTCTETGKTDGSRCTICGETITAQTVIPATGHTTETVKGTAPTCTKAGVTDGSRCTVCGATLAAQTVIAATGHTAETVKGTAPTCTKTGVTDGSCCTVCGATLAAQTTIPATGHTDNNDDGVCDTCQTVLREIEKPQTGCNCNCHKTGFMHFIFKVILFFQKLAGANKTCACGASHY